MRDALALESSYITDRLMKGESQWREAQRDYILLFATPSLSLTNVCIDVVLVNIENDCRMILYVSSLNACKVLQMRLPLTCSNRSTDLKLSRWSSFQDFSLVQFTAPDDLPPSSIMNISASEKLGMTSLPCDSSSWPAQSNLVCYEIDVQPNTSWRIVYLHLCLNTHVYTQQFCDPVSQKRKGTSTIGPSCSWAHCLLTALPDWQHCRLWDIITTKLCAVPDSWLGKGALHKLCSKSQWGELERVTSKEVTLQQQVSSLYTNLGWLELML